MLREYLSGELDGLTVKSTEEALMRDHIIKSLEKISKREIKGTKDLISENTNQYFI